MSNKDANPSCPENPYTSAGTPVKGRSFRVNRLNKSRSAGTPQWSNADQPRWFLLPAFLWMGVLFVIPLLIVLAVSVATRGTYGGIIWQFTLANYADLLHPLYGRILGQSLLCAALTTLLCLLIGFPFAYYIARAPRRQQSIWLMLVLVPFWTNFLVRTYAWMLILRTEGLVNGFLLSW